MPATPVLLDVDTGIDDAHALLLALRHPALEVRGVTTVAGNLDIDTVTAATLQVLDAAGAPPGLPVARGCAAPLVEPCHYCPLIHGEDGLGDLQPALPASQRRLDPRHAVAFIIDTLRQVDREGSAPITLIALAPLTNIGMALRMEPELCRRALASVVWMGGAAFAGGNASQWAEANAAYDPEAAHILLTSGVEVTMYTWDVYLQVDYSWRELLRLGGCCSSSAAAAAVSSTDVADALPDPSILPAAGLSGWSELSTRLLLRDMRHWGSPSAQIGDAGAVAIVIAGASSYEGRRMHVAVELSGGITRGMTVVDPREMVVEPDRAIQPPNVTVCVGVDAEAIKAVFSGAVLQPPASPAAVAAVHTGGAPTAKM